MSDKVVNIKNRKAYFEFEIFEKYVAGIKLMGSEIKSIRAGKASIGEGYCYFKKGELWVKKIHIAEYAPAAHYAHEPLRDRKLLLTKKEIQKLENKVKEKGLTVIPLRIFINERGYAKLEIGLAKGKKLHDKRESIKRKDAQREMERGKKINFR